MEQVEPTPWVSSVTFLMKPNREVRVCLDPSNLTKAIIREHHKPMTVEEIAHELAGATVFSLDNVQLTLGKTSLSKDAIWSQNEPRRVLAMDGCHSGTVPRSHRNTQ